MTSHLDSMRSHWYFVANTKPNMTVHRACARPGTKLAPVSMKGTYICYVCGEPIRGRRGVAA